MDINLSVWGFSVVWEYSGSIRLFLRFLLGFYSFFCFKGDDFFFFLGFV